MTQLISEKTFYERMSNAFIAQHFLAKRLPDWFSKQIHWDSLVIVPETFIDRVLFPTMNDIVYRVKTLTNHVYYILLIMGDQYTLKQPLMSLVQELMAKVMVRYQNKHRAKPFPLVYPLIVHTGTKPYISDEERKINDQELMFNIITESLKDNNTPLSTMYH